MSEHQKIALFFGQKGPDFVHFWAKFLIQNVVLIVYWRKYSKMFPCGSFFLVCFWRNVYWSALVPQKTSPALKSSGCRPASKHYSFCKILYLECLKVMWIHLCLNNCSVVCTVTLCWYIIYVAMYCIRPIHNSVIFRTLFIQVYWSIFSIIKAYSQILRYFLKHIKAYSGIFSTLCKFPICRTIFQALLFRTRGLFKTLWNFGQVYSETCYSQDTLSKHYWALFKHMQDLL